MGDQAQNIVLFLSDGRKIFATVPVFVKEDETIKVVNITIGQPYDLPGDCRWGDQNKTDSTDQI